MAEFTTKREARCLLSGGYQCTLNQRGRCRRNGSKPLQLEGHLSHPDSASQQAGAELNYTVSYKYSNTQSSCIYWYKSHVHRSYYMIAQSYPYRPTPQNMVGKLTKVFFFLHLSYVWRAWAWFISELNSGGMLIKHACYRVPVYPP